MKLRVLVWSVVSALAGFLFGFDTVVISGAEKAIQSLWNLTDEWHGVVVASAVYGTALGALVGSWPADRFGRKPTLLAVGVMYVVSAVGCGFAWDAGSFVLFRMVGGLGIGISTVAAPLYITEIAPPAYRGRLTALFQFNIVLGIVVALASNVLLKGVGGEAWRWMLGVAVLPSAAYFAACLVIPESPRWLMVRKGDRPAAVGVLRLVHPGRPDAELEAEADAMTAAAAHAPAGRFWSKRLLKPILLAVAIAAFNQLSGINAVFYFAPRIFETAGLDPAAADWATVALGVTNLLLTFVGLGLIDRLGRRTLILIGSVGYIASLLLTAWAVAAGQSQLVPYFLVAFIAAHAVGQGAVIWVFIAEVFPTRHRAAGQAVGSFTHWIFAAAITTLFLAAGRHFQLPAVFTLFAGAMVVQLLWAVFLMPETKGVPLEELEAKLLGGER